MLIADTGLWVALGHRRDSHHRLARRIVDSLTEPLVTTWPVIAETCHFLLSREGTLGPVTFIQSLAAGASELFELSQRRHTVRLAELMDRYADLPMDLADASLVVLAEHLGHGRILTTDRRDFGVYRWGRGEAFHNLLFEG